jgi:hypothetical protein
MVTCYMENAMRTIRSAFAAAVMLWAAAASAAQAPTAAQQAPWEDQIRAMGYLIMNLSSINVINGINLTREQALRLRELARKIEAVSPAAPDLGGTFRPDLGEVRDTYLELRGTLLAGKEVPETLEKRIMQARAVESAVLRLAAGGAQPTATGCLRCHGAPQEPDVRGLAGTKAALEKSLAPRPAGKEPFLAHENGLIGQQGLVLLVLLAPQVDAVLTAEQRAAFESFACCLVPPKSMTDPVRIGQAAGGEKEIGILRWVRSVPEDNWPASKAWAMDLWKAGLVIKSPGLSEAEKAKACERISRIYDQARALSDVDFELDKTALADQLHEVSTPTPNKSDGERKFSAALFLLGNGTVEAYDRLLERLDTTAKQAAK